MAQQMTGAFRNLTLGVAAPWVVAVPMGSPAWGGGTGPGATAVPVLGLCPGGVWGQKQFYLQNPLPKLSWIFLWQLEVKQQCLGSTRHGPGQGS